MSVVSESTLDFSTQDYSIWKSNEKTPNYDASVRSQTEYTIRSEMTDFDYHKAYTCTPRLIASDILDEIKDDMSQASSIREELDKEETVTEIFAPAGKLGLVIDTPADTGSPVVYKVKNTSPLQGKIAKGDRLIAIDDDDVTNLTAKEVSKIISTKVNSPSRKFSVIKYDA
eukprot:CAMPEP_0113322868 /NCGR_PEP_ID=MMETSP0010_2-20120614/15900_1 /TAXON_ID=216773 ORGANISM="Corethron hystrix, Strain 308" /NCGR_SAMPLE_ID=MMETSP0010_2 /ASSEMBLY_ACC=CAM_ASM_000155 /LENGTH=170 /DNA_ID=CAMNT_0000181527 /DNA_START=293 /DNA_END=805 /DNA_ORIENTATION=- /assembly_acc=CAM_ASM_000155